MTDNFVAKLDSKKFKLLKEPAPISSVESLFSKTFQISGLSVSSVSNGLVVFHIGSNDFIGCLINPQNEDRIGELVGVLAAHFEKYPLLYVSLIFFVFRQYNRKLPVSVGAALHCTLGSKPRSVHINATEPNHPIVFKSSGKDIEFIGPVISV